MINWKKKIITITYIKCELTAVNIPAINTLNIMTFRPPKNKLAEFDRLLVNMTEILREADKPEPKIIWCGVFNFHFLEWEETKEQSMGGYNSKSIDKGSVDEREQLHRGHNLYKSYNLIQENHKRTRGNNTIHLLFNNNLAIFSDRC